MTLYGVSADRLKKLRQRMHQINIYEKDIREKFVCSSGKGGQNVNKVATCVQLYHHPTRIQVKCQDQRSQGLNRYQARCLLLKKISDYYNAQELKKNKEAAKLSRQKRKRSLLSKERMLADKRKQSLKKENRRRVDPQ